MRKWTPVVILWKDAVTYHDPARSSDDFPAAERRSIGFFLKKNTASDVTICMEDDRSSKSPESDCQTVTTILAGMIVRIIELHEHPKRR